MMIRYGRGRHSQIPEDCAAGNRRKVASFMNYTTDHRNPVDTSAATKAMNPVKPYAV